MDLPGAFPLPTPPNSPRKRRMILRESEDTEGNLSIEEYLVRCDPYRTTTANFAWPYPLRTVPADASVIRQLNAHKDEILHVLQEDGFVIDEQYLKFRVDDVSKPGYPLGNNSQVTLRLMFDNDAFVPSRLGPTKDRIARIIHDNGILGVEVEIVFIDKCFRPSLFSVLSHEAAVKVYDSAKRQILALVKARLGQEWSILSLFKMGLTKRKSTPTITIFVNPHTTHDWADLALQIRLLLPHDDPEALNIPVEFIPGRLTSFNPGEGSNAPAGNGISFSAEMRQDGIPEAGTSITVLPERGGGSLGPFVTLSLAGKVYRGALTCYHVVRPPYVASAEMVDTANRFGSSPFMPHRTEYDVCYYSPRDVEATVSDLRGLIHESKEERKIALEEKEGREVAFARIPQGLHDRIVVHTKTIAELEAKLRIASKMPMKLGRTLASSGQTLSDNKLSDWAFIELEPKAFGNNHPRNTMPHIPPAYAPFDPQTDKKRVKDREPGQLLDVLGPLSKDQWYCKSGRTTGLTAGICNGVSTYCNWPAASRERFSKDGKERVRIEDGVTEEWVITMEEIGRDGKTQGIFLKEGDSGAGIINRYGDICGLAYGGAIALCGHTFDQASGLCSSIDDIKRWIEEKVPGSTLGLPY
ncbi:hypothetical protein BJX64DRAFT_282988 [Aspergillus heterothallicus]